jgi:endonuclease/exonuclease/phosphatase family metal-dependent hydrolase
MLSILTWNILHYEFVKEGGEKEKRDERWENICNFIFTRDYDLIGLQETCGIFAVYLRQYIQKRDLPYDVYYAGTDTSDPTDIRKGFYEPDDGWNEKEYKYGNISVVNTSRIETYESLFSPFDDPTKGNQSNAVLTTFERDGKSIVWVNTHLVYSHDQFDKLQQLSAIQNNINALGMVGSLIFSGDFNNVSVGDLEVFFPEMDSALQQFTRTFATKSGPPPAGRDFSELSYDNIFFTEMDFSTVLLGSELNMESQVLKCCDPYPCTSVRCRDGETSDHYPLYAELRPL